MKLHIPFAADWKVLCDIVTERGRPKLYRVTAIIIFAALLDLAGMTLLLPPVLGLVDPASLHNFPSWIRDMAPLSMSLSFTGLFLLKNIIVIFIHRYSGRYAFTEANRLSAAMLGYLHRLPLLDRRAIKLSDMEYRVAVIPSQFSQFYLVGLLQSISEACILIAGFLILLVWQPLVTLMVIATLVPIAVILYRYLRRRQRKLTTHNRHLLPEAYSQVSQVLRASQDIHTAGTYGSFAAKYAQIQAAYHRNQAGITLTSTLLPRTMEMLAALSILLFIAMAALQIAGRAELAFTAVLYATFSLRILPSVNRCINWMVQAKSYRFTADILLPVANLPDMTLPHIPFSSTISLNNISFHFPGEQHAFLKHISLQIPKGRCVGFYGRSGSGKSSLMRIIGGWYTPTEGQVLVDDIPLTAGNSLGWQRHTAWVQQDIFLLDDSLKANIALGSEVNEARMDMLLKQLGMEQWIGSLPQGLNTPAGELGSRLSGGQQQLIGIARALYHNAELLLFDEPSSSLDQQYAQNLVRVIHLLKQENKTICLISHQVNLLQPCDEIYRVENGSITGKTTYAELNG